MTEREQQILAEIADFDLDALDTYIHDSAADNRRIHEDECINLNPATNIMNPRAEALLAAGLGSRPSLGHPGEKYEMGLEAIEQIEVVTAELARRVFNADHAEVRVGSGALANLYAFMATCEPGDPVIVPPAAIGGHVTHNRAGAAGLYRLDIHEAPIDAERYTVDVDAVRAMALQVRPKLITIGASLNLTHHPVGELREIADEVGAKLLFDAAHLCGVIAGGAWPNPLDQGAHLMTMSTYKSLGGPASGLLVTNDAELAQKVDAIAYPGLTANFDVANTAALAVTLLDWLHDGEAYAHAMVANAAALADGLAAHDVATFTGPDGTISHQLAVDARAWDGGHPTALRLRKANLLTCAIGLPTGDGDGLRLGTPEITRIGMQPDHMAELAEIVAAGLHGEPELVAPRATALRRQFGELQHVRR